MRKNISLDKIARKLSEGSGDTFLKNEDPFGDRPRGKMVNYGGTQDGDKSSVKPDKAKAMTGPSGDGVKHVPRGGDLKPADMKPDSKNALKPEKAVKWGKDGKSGLPAQMKDSDIGLPIKHTSNDSKDSVKPDAAKSMTGPKGDGVKKASDKDVGLPIKHEPAGSLPALYIKEKPSESDWSPAEKAAFDKLQGAFIQGMDPTKAKKITVKTMRPRLDIKGLLTYGGIVEPTGKTGTPTGGRMVKESANPIAGNGIVNGRVELKIGQREHVFETVDTAQIRKIAQNYAEVGQPVSITVRLGWRSAYSDRLFRTAMTEAAHAGAMGHKKWREQALMAALGRFVSLNEGERLKSFHPTREGWVLQIAKPAFKQAIRTFDSLYEHALRPFDVQVQAKTGRGREVIDVATSAINERCAAALAFQAVSEDVGPDAEMIHAFVGPTKFVFEEAMKSFGAFKPNFEDLEKNISAAGLTTVKKRSTDPTAAKATEHMKTPNGTAKGATKQDKLAKGKDNAESLADKNPGGKDVNSKMPNIDTTVKSTGPVYEAEVLRVMADAGVLLGIAIGNRSAVKESAVTGMLRRMRAVSEAAGTDQRFHTIRSALKALNEGDIRSFQMYAKKAL